MLNVRDYYYTSSFPGSLYRLGLGESENLWQYNKICNNRHDIRTRRPDGKNYYETSVEFMRGTPYESWMVNDDSIVEWTSATFQEYMTDIKKTPKQKATFENALQKRTAIKVDSISAYFISLGTIWKSIQHKDYCEMNFAPQYTFKSQSTKSCGERNDEIWFNNFDLSEEVSSIVVRKKGKCFEQNQMFKADYFAGHYEDSKLFF